MKAISLTSFNELGNKNRLSWTNIIHGMME